MKKYAVVPIANFQNLQHYYAVINQIFHGDPPQPIAWVLLESELSQAQETEIANQGGQIFETTDQYNDWLQTITE